MQNKTKILAPLFLFLLLSGCFSKSIVYQRENFQHYLDQFIGQTREQVINTINFQSQGFATASRAQSLQTETQLVYSILRPVNIPKANTALEQPSDDITPSSATTYQHNMTCTITFHFHEQKVDQWQATGKAC